MSVHYNLQNPETNMTTYIVFSYDGSDLTEYAFNMHDDNATGLSLAQDYADETGGWIEAYVMDLA